MTDDSRQITSSAGRTFTVLQWSVHLAARSPTKLCITLCAIAIASAAAFAMIGPAGSVTVVFMLAGALAEFLFPVSFELRSDAAICKTLFKQSRIRWTDVKTCYLDEHGVKLSPLDPGSRLEAFRGVFLRFGDNREEVIETVMRMRC